RKKRSFDLCAMHYDRQLHGRDMDAIPVHGVAKRFLADHLMEPSTGCRLWPFSTAGAGYGHIVVKGKTVYVHIVACEAWNGPMPQPGMHAAHSCDNPSCWAGEHLRWATVTENIADQFARSGASRAARAAAGRKRSATVQGRK